MLPLYLDMIFNFLLQKVEKVIVAFSETLYQFWSIETSNSVDIT